MVRLDRIYTGGGDEGETSLGDGSRVPKTDQRVVAMGAVDELNGVLGIVVADGIRAEWAAGLRDVQNDLFDLGADVAVPESSETDVQRLCVTRAHVERLERWIDDVNSGLEPLTSFVLPGGTPLAARLHHARSVCRRAEIALVSLAGSSPMHAEARRYLNRLSDLLFVLARAANDDGDADVLWRPGAGSGRERDAGA